MSGLTKRPMKGIFGGDSDSDDEAAKPLVRFDESDDDEQVVSATAPAEEDLLDAFMSNLSESTTTTSTETKKRPRLDIEAEDAHEYYEPNGTVLEEEDQGRGSKKSKTRPLLLPRTDHAVEIYPSFNKVFVKCIEGGDEIGELINLDEETNSYILDNEIAIDPPLSVKTFPIVEVTQQVYPSSSSSSSSSSTAHPEEEDEEEESSSLFPPLSTYSSIPSAVITVLSALNIQKLTPIQAISLPLLMSGRNLLATSSTGSGKTLAFCLPLIPHILDQTSSKKGDGPIAVILSPTRELVHQTFLVLKRLLSTVKSTVLPIYGGTSTSEQNSTWAITKQLKAGVDVLVATPARLIDFVRQNAANLRRVTYLVLDEGDRLATTEFEHQVSTLLGNINPNAQRIVFSATCGNAQKNCIHRWLNPHQGSGEGFTTLAVGKVGSSSVNVEQDVIICRKTGSDATKAPAGGGGLSHSFSKNEWLFRILPSLVLRGKLIIFVARRVDCETLSSSIENDPNLTRQNITVDTIHGDKDQIGRNKALGRFKKGEAKVLIATDVAARGLDVKDVQTVINLGRPKNLDAYSHRVGRAGRLNNSSGNEQKVSTGRCFTLLDCSPGDRRFGAILLHSFQREKRGIQAEFHAYVGEGESGKGRW
jgi:superfamily II DNA/RNA helicase